MDNNTDQIKQQWGRGVFDLISWFDMERVRKARVLVVGAGALGNEVIKNLALFGVGHIYVVDFDRVEYSNLTRSILFSQEDANKQIFKVEAVAQSVRAINPSVEITPIVGYLDSDVGLGLYRNVDVVIGCLDSRLARIQLNRQCIRASVPWVNGGIINLEGNVEVFRKGESCYECQIPPHVRRQLSRHISCSDIAKRNLEMGRMPTTPVIASIIGAMQVQEALKIIHEDIVPETELLPLRGRLFKYDGARLATRFVKTALWNSNCYAHENWDNIISVPDLSADRSVAETLTFLSNVLQSNDVEINMMNTRFVERIVTKEDNVSYSIMCSETRVADFIDNNPLLKGLDMKDINQKTYENIDRSFPYQNISLRQLGIPYWDIIQVSTDRGVFYVELTKDRNKYNPNHDCQ